MDGKWLVFVISISFAHAEPLDPNEALWYNDNNLKKIQSLPWSVIGWPNMNLQDEMRYKMGKLEETYRPWCDRKSQGFQTNFQLLYIKSPLPDGCSNLRICNSTTCLELGFSSFFYARMFRYEYQDYLLGLTTDSTDSDFSAACKKQVVISRESCSDPTFCCPKMFLPFNLPGHRFCKPCPVQNNTFISEAMMTPLDKECRRHYLATRNGVSTHEEIKFLSNVRAISPNLFKTFFAASKSKHIYEQMTDRSYGSVLYSNLFTTQNVQSLEFIKISELDHIPFNRTDLKLVRVLQELWMTDVKNIWTSICYSNLMNIEDAAFLVTRTDNSDSSTCPFIEIKGTRQPRGTVPENFDSSKKGLRFTLPGFRYCGPGTIIKKMDEIGGPVNEVDNACRNHDLAYSVAKTDGEIWTADDILLKEVKNASTILYPAFKFFFSAKYLYELQFGSPYKPNLKLAIQSGPEEGSTKINYVEEQVEFDINVKNPWFKIYDEAWRKSVKDIWQGSCNREVMNRNPADINVDLTSQCDKADFPQPHINTPIFQQDTELEMQCDRDFSAWVIPNPPPKYGKCRIVINEFNLMWMDHVFLELAKLCPPGARGVYNLLLGYFVIIFTGDENPEIVFSADLQDYQMRTIEPTNYKNPRSKSFFVLGTHHVPGVDKTLFTSSSVGGTNRFVPSDDRTYGLALLFLPGQKGRNSDKKALQLISIGGRAQAKQMQSKKELYLRILRNHVQDIVFFGKECSDSSCNYFNEVFNAFDPSSVFGKPELTIDHSDTISWNLCDGLFPMQRQFFQVSIATPKQDNNCNPKPDMTKEKVLKHPFSFPGVRLQTTAQRMIVNAEYYFGELIKDPALLKSTARLLTSDCLNINKNMISTVINNHNNKIDLKTPSRKKKVTYCRVQGTIDSFDDDYIKRLIQSYYNKGTPALFTSIYTDFMKYKTDSVPEFKCGRQTFSRILHRIGFKYGTINQRAVLIQREDNVMSRGKYLKRIRKNDAAPPAEKYNVAFIDETWIDPYERAGKGWIMKHCSLKDEALYSYQKQKGLRGGRIIVISAGGDGGTIPGSTRVYAVKKNSKSDDYHENIGFENFIDWFEHDLLERLEEPTIIVMDNARYHSSSSAPKQSQRKSEIYNWLVKQKEEGKLLELKSENDYRKFELWDIVMDLKAKHNFYKVDELASLRGHEVVRLAPYNCDLNPIELVWKDVKHDIRKQNLQQDVKAIVDLAAEMLESYNASRWQKHIQHVKKLEEQYWVEDGHVETVINDLRIIVDDDDESLTGEDACDEVEDDEKGREVSASQEEEDLSELLHETDYFPMRAIKCARRLDYRN